MKQKTKKAASKRFNVTSTGKVRHRAPHQAHFNARATGKQGRDKHGAVYVVAADRDRITRLMPYN